MTKNDIIIALVSIVLFICFLSLFLKLIKPKQKSKVEETKPEQKPEAKEEEKAEEVIQPKPISLALQDELNEFKGYLKERITPEIVPLQERNNHSYNTPRVSPRFEDFDRDFDLPFRKPKEKKNSYQDLPDEVKILLFTNFFDTKF